MDRAAVLTCVTAEHSPSGPGIGSSELLRDRVALVTGSSRGIGASIARALGAHGATVAINYLSSESLAREVAADVEAAGGRAEAFRADVTDADAVTAMVAAIDERFGPVDVLVNSALRAYAFDPLARRTAWEIEWKDYERQFAGSVGGAFNACRAVLPGMRERGNGRVVNLVTDLIERPSIGYHDYTTAKTALLGFSRNLATDLGPFGITVNCVAPGLVYPTDASRLTTDEQRDELEAATPLRRLARPEDVAGAVLYFASDWSSFVTGACLYVDGGLVMG